MVYVIHEIPIFIAMGVVGKDGRGLQAQPSCEVQRSSWPRPCWLSRAVEGPPRGTAPQLPHSESMGGPSILGRPLRPPATWAAFPESQTPICSFHFPGGILGAVFNALNYWLTMFRIR